MDPPKTYGWKEELSLNFFLPPLCTHALLPYLSSPPPMFFHLLSFSLWTFPTLLTPPCGSLETCVRAIAHDSGTVQTTMRKEGLGKNWNLEGGASHRAQSGVSHNPSPGTIYIYCIFFQCCCLRFILVSWKKTHCSLCRFVKLSIRLN